MPWKDFFSWKNRRFRATALALLLVVVALSLGAWGGWRKNGKLMTEPPKSEESAPQESQRKPTAREERAAKAEKAREEKAAEKAKKAAEKEAKKNAAKKPASAANPSAPTPPPTDAKPKDPAPKPPTPPAPPAPKKKSLFDWFKSSKSSYEEVQDALQQAEKDLSKKKYVDAMQLAAKAVSKIREQELDKFGSEDATAEQFREAIKRAESVAAQAGKNVEKKKVPYYKATYVEL